MARPGCRGTSCRRCRWHDGPHVDAADAHPNRLRCRQGQGLSARLRRWKFLCDQAADGSRHRGRACLERCRWAPLLLCDQAARRSRHRGSALTGNGRRALGSWRYAVWHHNAGYGRQSRAWTERYRWAPFLLVRALPVYGVYTWEARGRRPLLLSSHARDPLPNAFRGVLARRERNGGRVFLPPLPKGRRGRQGRSNFFSMGKSALCRGGMVGWPWCVSPGAWRSWLRLHQFQPCRIPGCLLGNDSR